ncbi:MAG: nitroreductase family protein, partial [Intestinibacter sp.]|uniref:nitroreductase family protein n=1 Tax=Intestinibacter sp. TaxID=1965304 RepID=UPI003F13A2DC
EKFLDSRKKLVNDISVEIKTFSNDVIGKLQGIAGYHGKIVEAPNYMILLSDVKDFYIENAGYVGECLILKARDLGLGTCWITFKSSDEIKKALDISSDKEVVAIIAIGYSGASKGTKKSAVKVGDNYSKASMDLESTTPYKLGVEDIVYVDTWGNNATIELLEERYLIDAFSISRLAPSTLNQQPWRFIIDGGKVILAIKQDDFATEYERKIDTGIALLYFSIVIDTTLFDLHWTLGEIENTYNVPDDYKIVAYCNV